MAGKGFNGGSGSRPSPTIEALNRGQAKAQFGGWGGAIRVQSTTSTADKTEEKKGQQPKKD